MVSDNDFFRINGIDYQESIARLDGAIGPGKLSLVQRTDSMVTYDCDWVRGPYVNVVNENGHAIVELDGNAEGFSEAESLLEEHLRTSLVEVE